MDPVSLAKFEEIIHKDISAITEADKIFLRARSSYLGRRGREKFKDILEVSKKEAKATAVKKAEEVKVKEEAEAQSAEDRDGHLGLEPDVDEDELEDEEEAEG